MLKDQCEKLATEISRLHVLDFPTAQRVGRLAKDLVRQQDTHGVPELLALLRDSCHDNNAKAMVLNNLASVERRLGRAQDALASLQQAVKLEGGMAHALPTTLVNLSAVLHTVGKFAEAAAVASKAVAQCQSHRPSSPSNVAAGSQARRTQAAACYNLGAALESSNEHQYAEEAYRDVLTLVDITDQYGSAAHRALEGLAMQQRIPMAEYWATTVSPALARQAANPAKRLLRPLPPLPGTSSLITASDPSTRNHRSSTALEVYDASRSTVNHSTGHRSPPNNNTIRSDISDVYHESVRRYHSLPPLLSPTPYDERHVTSRSDALTLSVVVPDAVTPGFLPAAHASPAGADVPDWNPDPVLASHSLSHRVKHPSERKNYALIHEVNYRFIPKALVPLVEDIRYKESTRRTMIKKEWKRRFEVIRAARDLATFTTREDGSRVAIEIEEARVRRVVKQWIIGKLLFVEATIKLDKEEAVARESVLRELAQAASLLHAFANRLHPQAVEEVTRADIAEEERTARSMVAVDREAHVAIVQTRAAVKQSVHGLAYALALWCLEGVIPEEDMVRIEDKSRKSSIFVLERYSTFGRQKKPTSATS